MKNYQCNNELMNKYTFVLSFCMFNLSFTGS